jgi:hypothetical protein
MFLGILFSFPSTWDLVKNVSINVFWIFWYLPRLKQNLPRNGD